MSGAFISVLSPKKKVTFISCLKNLNISDKDAKQFDNVFNKVTGYALMSAVRFLSSPQRPDQLHDLRSLLCHG
jgi:hypothetical protein